MQTKKERMFIEADFNILIRLASNYGYSDKDFILEKLDHNLDGFKITRAKDTIWFIAQNHYEEGIITSSLDEPDNYETKIGGYFEKFCSGNDFSKQFQKWIQLVSILECRHKKVCL